MAVPSTVVYGPMVDRRLAQLDLTSEDLHESLRTGFTHAAGCTKHDPRGLAGTLIWGKGIGHLRDRTKARHWLADSIMNYETAVHPSGSHAVAISAGNSATGRPDGAAPRTRRPKGSATQLVVKRNAQLQLGHGTDVFAGIGQDAEDDARVTWLLLHYYEAGSGKIWAELSCPSAMTGPYITAWHERLLLAPIEFGTDLSIPSHDDEDEDSIDIDVQRRL